MSNTYITHVGRKALDDAVAAGRAVKIAKVIVDSHMLPDDIDARTLTAVQHNPTDQTGKSAIYPVSGHSSNGEVLIAWALPANSGGYDINGLGFLLDDGTLFAYQRRALGSKPLPNENAFFEPRGTLKYKNSDASSITIDLDLTGHFATLADVEYFINEHELEVRKLLRKIEGTLGQVRLYTRLRDVDSDYLPIIGQTIKKTDYPDYFKHLGVTASTLRLPDWSNRYVRQLSEEYGEGEFLEDLIKAHNHTATIADGGSFTPTAYPIDLGKKSSTLVLNGRFHTNQAGSHTHKATASSAGEHNHSISINSGGGHSHSASSGDAGGHNHGASVHAAGEHSHSARTGQSGSHSHEVPTEPDGTGGGGAISSGPHRETSHRDTRVAGSHTHLVTVDRAGNHGHGITINSVANHSHSVRVDAVGGHTHSASSGKVAAHSHTVSTETSGSHGHYVDVNFGTKTVSMTLGSYTVKLHKVSAHSHTATINSTGGSENRPKSVVGVFAVKTRYLVDL